MEALSISGLSKRTPSMPTSLNSSTPRNTTPIANGLPLSAPTASNSIMNKIAVPGKSLYQYCLSLRDRLMDVPGFELWLTAAAVAANDPEDSTASIAMATGMADDPVSQLWRCFRLGAPLCVLFNAMKPKKELVVNADVTFSNPNAGKASVYHFLLGCRNELGMGDDELFTISQLYQDDTSGFVHITKTVSLVLDKLEEKDMLVKRDKSRQSTIETDGPKDNRDKVVLELLETERKYVQDLELLQHYMRELQAQEIVSADTIHMLFANLNTLVDFQRRFLIGVEGNAAKPPDQQRFGALFLTMEEGFSVYEPFCSNYTYANELAIEETPKLMKLSHLVEPSYELPSLLIKPIQRICKYPLLLKELVRYTDNADPNFEELEAGMESVKRVTDRVNETRRKQENEVVVMELERRVEDWKGHSVASFGSLLLEDMFHVTKGEVEREYHVYLFERILLCCKEVSATKKQAKNLSINKKTKKRGSLQLKGRIFINNMVDIVPHASPGLYTLQVYWRGDVDQEYFSLRCRNEENLKQWTASLTRLIEDTRAMRARMEEARLPNVPNSTNPRQISNTQFVSLQNLDLGYRPNSESDDEDDSYRGTRPSYEAGHEELSSFPMSREASTSSVRSRSTTADSVAGSINYPARGPSGRYPVGGPRVSTSTDSASYGHSFFSPSPITESPNSSARGSTGNGGYPFPRTSMGSSINGDQNRFTAPAMGRTTSRDSNNHPPSRQPSMSRPAVLARNRSASSPNVPSVTAAKPGVNGVPPMPHPPTSAAMYRAQSNNVTSPSMLHAPHSRTSMSSQGTSSIPPTPSLAGIPNNQIKVKVNYLDDIFVVVVAPNISYEKLMERVEKKVRLCGDRSAADLSQGIRMKYMDEDGDLITINSDEDVGMAIEAIGPRDEGGILGGGSVLSLYVA
ncbi:Guanine nucleotide exchange factor for Cdc42p [Saitoella coloradoensis]